MLSNYKKSVHFVLDIETLGTRPGCPILSIGAVKMYNGILERQQEFFASLGSNVRLGLNEIGVETLRWWEEKHPEQFRRLQANSENRELSDALEDLNQFCNPIVQRIALHYYWSKHPHFDFPILEAAYEAIGKPPPWKYWQIRDIATLEDKLFTAREPELNNHDALLDAINEANVLIDVVWGDEHDR